MPALTRRRYPERPDCWHVYYGDVHVGTLASRAGVPVDVDQWAWSCGFYPGMGPGQHQDGTAETFEDRTKSLRFTMERLAALKRQLQFSGSLKIFCGSRSQLIKQNRNAKKRNLQ
jgi:hypothetical protein